MRAPIRLIALLLCLFAAAAHGQTTQDDDDAQLKAAAAQVKADLARVEKATHIPDPAAGDRWQDIAKAQHWPQPNIDAIARDKVLFGHEEFRQVFQPYVAGGYPAFVTSDSALNAYNVLFEESMRRMEVANVGKLHGILRSIWKHLPNIDAKVYGNAALSADAKLRAQIIIAVSLRLLGDESLKVDPALEPLVAEQVKKILEAHAMEKPKWLGPPDADFEAIDYSRFTPRGFYTQSPMLEGYFCADAWLQAIPFRVDHDAELLSVAMIASAAEIDDQNAVEQLYSEFDALLGRPDDPDLKSLVHCVDGDLKIDLHANFLDDFRRDLLRDLSLPRAPSEINDQLRITPADSSKITLRILSARRTPDAAYFQDIMKNRPLDAMPSGLDLSAALGSSYATQIAPKLLPAAATLLGEKTLHDGTLYCQYLYCLQALLAPPEKDAPAFMAGKAWQAKSCQTTLAGWAQLKHTWQLQAKEDVSVFGETIRPPGFVEPVPEFYERMARLCARTGGIVQGLGTEDPDFSQLGGAVHQLIGLGEKMKASNHSYSRDFEPDAIQSKLLDAAEALQLKHNESSFSNDVVGLLPELKEIAADLDRGILPVERDAVKALSKQSGPDIADLWRRLRIICLRLDAMSNKQLRGVDFNEDENGFLRGYGAELAGVMLYESNSYEIPLDDAPRIADVYRNPIIDRYLEVAIGRPRALYVLYPYHGGEVLCEGAVMPYYEFPHATPMTDADWMAMLDSKTPPKPMISVP